MEKNAEINFATIFESHDQKKVQTLNLLFFFFLMKLCSLGLKLLNTLGQVFKAV